MFAYFNTKYLQTNLRRVSTFVCEWESGGWEVDCSSNFQWERWFLILRETTENTRMSCNIRRECIRESVSGQINLFGICAYVQFHCGLNDRIY